MFDYTLPGNGRPNGAPSKQQMITIAVQMATEQFLQLLDETEFYTEDGLKKRQDKIWATLDAAIEQIKEM